MKKILIILSLIFVLISCGFEENNKNIKKLNKYCEKPDIKIKNQTWAGCNSFQGIKNNKKDSNLIKEFKNYKKNGYLYGANSAKEIACGGKDSGYHLPSKKDFEILLNNLGCNTNNINGRICKGYGGQSLKLKNSNLIEALNLPFAGNCYPNNFCSNYNTSTHLWTNTVDNGKTYSINITNFYDEVSVFSESNNNAYSVRCIKD